MTANGLAVGPKDRSSALLQGDDLGLAIDDLDTLRLAFELHPLEDALLDGA